MEIKDELLAFMKRTGYKMPRIASLTGLPLDSLYKWRKGTAPSNGEHVLILRDLFSGKLESVPKKNDKPVESRAGVITMAAEDRIAELLRDKEVLRESIQISLNALLQGQQELRVMLKTTQQNLDDVLIDAGREPEKVKEQTGKRNAANLHAMTRTGKDERIPDKI